MLRLEFHSHTIYSKDSLTTPEALIAACRRKGLDRIVVTDHNTIAGALQAQRLAPELVIVGEEIMTQQGELLAAFVSQEVPPGLTALESIEQLRQQGAFISVSHPFDHFRQGAWQLDDLLRIAPLVDAIETFNSRCMFAKANQQAQAFAMEHGLLGTAGSDAHTTWELGRAAMLLPDFTNAIELKEALQEARFETRLSPAWIHFSSRYAVWFKKLTDKNAPWTH
jgi:predicted metal-dependent phosphoesterase TrpH